MIDLSDALEHHGRRNRRIWENLDKFRQQRKMCSDTIWLNTSSFLIVRNYKLNVSILEIISHPFSSEDLNAVAKLRISIYFRSFDGKKKQIDNANRRKNTNKKTPKNKILIKLKVNFEKGQKNVSVCVCHMVLASISK